MGKLTLSVDEEVVARAKRYAAGRRTSVSRLVEQYLHRLARAIAILDQLAAIGGLLR